MIKHPTLCPLNGHSKVLYNPVNLNECILSLTKPYIGSDKWIDYSGYGNDGTIHGATKDSNGFLSFDGVDDYVNCVNNESLNITNTIVIDTLLKPTNLSGNHTFIFKNLNYQISTYDQQLKFAYQSTDDTWHGYKTNTDIFTLNTWKRLVIVFTYGINSSMKIYINGENISGSWYAGTGDLPTKTSVTDLWIGKGNADYLNGSLIRTHIFSVKMPTFEIAQPITYPY